MLTSIIVINQSHSVLVILHVHFMVRLSWCVGGYVLRSRGVDTVSNDSKCILMMLDIILVTFKNTGGKWDGSLKNMEAPTSHGTYTQRKSQQLENYSFKLLHSLVVFHQGAKKGLLVHTSDEPLSKSRIILFWNGGYCWGIWPFLCEFQVGTNKWRKVTLPFETLIGVKMGYLLISSRVAFSKVKWRGLDLNCLQQK
jgi:hypothetical protein